MIFSYAEDGTGADAERVRRFTTMHLNQENARDTDNTIIFGNTSAGV